MCFRDVAVKIARSNILTFFPTVMFLRYYEPTVSHRPFSLGLNTSKSSSQLKEYDQSPEHRLLLALTFTYTCILNEIEIV